MGLAGKMHEDPQIPNYYEPRMGGGSGCGRA